MKKLCIALALLLCISFCVGAEAGFIHDEAGILTAQEQQTLNGLASQLSRDAGCGIYVWIIEDYYDYGYDIEDVADRLYRENGLGLSEGQDGVLLLLSMDDRDYTIYNAGTFAGGALTDYGAAELSLSFLDNFRENDWNGGIADFLRYSSQLMLDARDGKILTAQIESDSLPEDEFLLMRWGILGLLVISALVGGIVILVLRGQLRSVAVKREANSYVLPGSFQIRQRSDLYTHTTRTERKIEKSSSHSGSSSGGSRTGKF